MCGELVEFERGYLEIGLRCCLRLFSLGFWVLLFCVCFLFCFFPLTWGGGGGLAGERGFDFGSFFLFEFRKESCTCTVVTY